MPYTLSPEDRAAIEAAADVLKRSCAGPVRCASISFNSQCGGFFGATAHDHHEAFSCGKYPKSSAELPDAFDKVLSKIHDKNPDEETRKAQRVAELREQLARLEGEPA